MKQVDVSENSTHLDPSRYNLVSSGQWDEKSLKSQLFSSL